MGEEKSNLSCPALHFQSTLARFSYPSWWEIWAKVRLPSVQNTWLNLEGKIGNVTNLTSGLGIFLFSWDCFFFSYFFFQALLCHITPSTIMHNLGICLIQKHSVKRSNWNFLLNRPIHSVLWRLARNELHMWDSASATGSPHSTWPHLCFQTANRASFKCSHAVIRLIGRDKQRPQTVHWIYKSSKQF